VAPAASGPDHLPMYPLRTRVRFYSRCIGAVSAWWGVTMGGKHRLTALYELAPQWAHCPLMVLATVATVIAPRRSGVALAGGSDGQPSVPPRKANACAGGAPHAPGRASRIFHEEADELAFAPAIHKDCALLLIPGLIPRHAIGTRPKISPWVQCGGRDPRRKSFANNLGATFRP
jgi:hypothetical protein